jgi:hypothetical protein
MAGKSDAAVYTDFDSVPTLMTTVISKRHPNQSTIDAGNRALLRPTDEVKGRAEVKVEKIRAANTEFLPGRMRQGFQTGRPRRIISVEPGHEHGAGAAQR